MTHDGVVVVDKPAAMTSHDVVARVRRLAGQRKVGHAGTLDPMATGVLVLGLGRATRLLGHLATQDKAYEGTIRLGVSTLTDDAEGEVTARVDPSAVTPAQVAAALQQLTGDIEQVPASVSAVKVAGERAYRRVRAGEDVVLAPRPVHVARLELVAPPRRGEGFVDLDVEAEVSSGTYVRALARDLGTELGVGGHLTRLRRTRVGGFGLSEAHSLDALAEHFTVTSLGESVAAAFPRRVVGVDDAASVAHGRPLPSAGETGLVGVFDEQGRVLALMGPSEREGEDVLRVVVGLTG